MPFASGVTILPSINVSTFREVAERVKTVEPYVRWCHLDVTDGIFSKHSTWNDPADLPKLETKLSVEVHLMIKNPELVIEQWLIPPVQRIIVHIEAVEDWDILFRRCREKGIGVGISHNPETPWEKLKPWFGKVDLLQILCVPPGASGQHVDWAVMWDKLVHLKESCPGCIIEMDGGINPDTAKRATELGAMLLVAGSYIFDSQDPRAAIESLCSFCRTSLNAV